MRPLWRAVSIAGGVLGAAAGTVAAATAVQSTRYHRERTAATELTLDELPGTLTPYRESTVTADDGVPLSVEEIEPAPGGPAELTVVLVHGYGLDRRCWHFQRRDLAHLRGPRVRQVLYDQRSHGRSGRAPREACTIEQLGRDLDAVIRAVAPDGPLVLLGHSMGGMTIMALAEQHPELFAERVRGVALVSTSAGEVGRSGLPRPFLSKNNPLMIAASRIAAWQPGTIERGRRAGGDLVWGLTRRFAFGDRAVSPVLVDLMDDMISGTPVDVLTDFLPTLGAHDRYAALAGLRHTEVLVIGGDADRLIPYRHAEAIAALVPGAELVRVPGAGHMAMMEQPDFVTEHVEDLLTRSVERRRTG